MEVGRRETDKQKERVTTSLSPSAFLLREKDRRTDEGSKGAEGGIDGGRKGGGEREGRW